MLLMHNNFMTDQPRNPHNEWLQSNDYPLRGVSEATRDAFLNLQQARLALAGLTDIDSRLGAAFEHLESAVIAMHGLSKINWTGHENG
jgi:hypothetical protein